VGELKATGSKTENMLPTPATMLKNPRWERFAHAIARGLTIDKAYQEAGYSANRGNASRLNAVERVKTRVVQLKNLVENLQLRSTHSVVLTQAWVIENLVSVVFAAKDQGDFAGMNRALHLLGLQLGMFVNREEIGRPGEYDGLTIEEKRVRIRALVDQLHGGVSAIL
jgi:phage terminase small subunit